MLNSELYNRLDRREFLGVVGTRLVTTMGAIESACSRDVTPIRTVAFDALAVFDPRPVFHMVEEEFPGHGAQLSELWRGRQFEYSWLRALSKNYADFWQVTQQALVFAAGSLKVELSAEKRARLMNAYLKLKPWPDAPPVLDEIKQAGLKLALLSNFTLKMLQSAVKSSRLEGTFEQLLSTDAVRTYKPDPGAYQMACDAFGLRAEEIAFAAFGGWDAAGARRFGYPTFWVNRMNLPAEELGYTPDATGATLDGLRKFLASGGTL